MGSLWNRSGTIERYADDIRAPGAKAYFFQGGTTTPFTVYRDAAESSAHPTPVLSDANGRWPDIFIPYTTSYDVQVKTADDVQLTYSVQVPNPNPVDVTTIVDPSNTVQTGMVHGELVNTTKTGYVRLNGRTIGNAFSAATERANDDTLALFTYLWNSNIPDATVSGGKGSSAASDFSPGNKTIVLPNCQGALFVGLDDMGTTAGGFFTGLTFTNGNAITGGSLIGGNSVTLTTAQMPVHSHTGTTGTDSPKHRHSLTVNPFHLVTTTGFVSADHTHHIDFNTGGQSADHNHAYNDLGTPGGTPVFGVGGGHAISQTGGTSNDHVHRVLGDTGGISANHTHQVDVTFTISASVGDPDRDHTHTFTTDTAGGTTGTTQPFNNLPRSRLVTWYIKL